MDKEKQYNEVTLDVLRNLFAVKESIKSKRKGLFGKKLFSSINMDEEYAVLEKARDRLSYFLEEFRKYPCFERDMQYLWITVAEEFIKVAGEVMKVIDLLRYSYFSLSMKDKLMYEKQFDSVQEQCLKNLMNFSQEYFDKYELKYS